MPDDGNIRFLPPREVRPATGAIDFSDRLKLAGDRAELTLSVMHAGTSAEAFIHTGSDVDRQSAVRAIHQAQAALLAMLAVLSPPPPSGLRAQLEGSVALLDNPEPPEAA